MIDSIENSACSLTGPARLIRGFAFGSSYPSLIFDLNWYALDAKCLHGLTERLKEIERVKATWGNFEIIDLLSSSKRANIQYFLKIINTLQLSANIPIFEEGKIVNLNESLARCQVPIFPRAVNAMLGVIQALITCCNAHTTSIAPDALTSVLENKINLLELSYSVGSNVPRFLKAAFDHHIPFHELAGDVIQYGQASKGRWLQSSFTDATPQISALLARDKNLTSRLLKQSGIPVPRQEFVKSEIEATQAAEKIGYPVVVKPSDLDGGLGVAAGLNSADEVILAYRAACKFSKNILLEKHIYGLDYRLTVFQGEVLWTIERQPAGVLGDGISSVHQLIELVNSDPRRGDGPHAPLKKLKLDEESLGILQSSGFDAHSIPPKAQFVPLRRNANIATGGMPRAVLNDIHPDNKRLAVRAAQALKLDLAGVDLLIPDINKSWLEGGAAICEVNAQPNLGQTTSAHLYPLVLKKLVKGDGRIPIMMVIGHAKADALVKSLELTLSSQDRVVGTYDSQGLRVRGERVAQAGITAFEAGQILLGDADVEIILMVIKDTSLVDKGLPFQRFDLLLLMNDFDRSSSSNSILKAGNQQLISMLSFACDGDILGMDFDKDEVFTNINEARLIDRLLKFELKHDEGENRY